MRLLSSILSSRQDRVAAMTFCSGTGGIFTVKDFNKSLPTLGKVDPVAEFNISFNL